MKAIAVLTAIVAMPLLASGALASSPEGDDSGDDVTRIGEQPQNLVAVFTPTVTVDKTQPTRTPAVVKFRPPPLQLPDIKGFMKRIETTKRVWLAPQLRKAQHVVAFFENPRHKWMLASRKPKCWEVPWQRLCTLARAKLHLNHALAERAQYRLDHELPIIGDWKIAVNYIQRIYPGTESWLLYISDREGGYGPWVWYGGRHWSGYHVGNDFLGSDTVGGWMQFRFSTFAPYYRGMVKDMTHRGYVLPEWPNRGGPQVYQPWLDPLAQALTAGYMRYYGKDGCHWCL